VLAGLWPAARGSLALPEPSDVMITPQKGYLPLDSLRGALLYPNPSLVVPDRVLAEALDKVGLGGLASRLDDVARWDQVLSNGERQRLAVARLLVHKPRLAVLDDALSALEESAQAGLLARLRSELPETTIVSLGQRPALSGVHARQMRLERQGEAAALMPAAAPALSGA
jgi:putative ATP-binding cassette transporter